MRRNITLGLVASSLALGACGGGGGGKATKEDLGKAVIEALTKKDKAAFTGLYVTVDQVMSACSGMEAMKDKLAERFTKTLAKAGENFDKCAGLDWSKAKLIEGKGGDLKEADDKCPALTEMKDYNMVVEIDGKKIEVKLDDPIKLKDGLFLADRFECESADEAKPADVAPTEPAPTPAAAPTPAPAEPAAAPTPAPADPAAAPTPAPAAAAGTGVCDKFVASYEKCIAAVPEQARGPMQDALKQMKDAWAQVPDKTMIEGACQQGYDTMKKSMGQMCPGAFE